MLVISAVTLGFCGAGLQADRGSQRSEIEQTAPLTFEGRGLPGLGVADPGATPDNGNTSLHLTHQPVVSYAWRPAEDIAVQEGIAGNNLAIEARENIPGHMVGGVERITARDTGPYPRDAEICVKMLTEAKDRTDLGIVADGAHADGCGWQHIGFHTTQTTDR